MIDFQNASYFKLKEVKYSDFSDLIDPILSDGESIIGTYRGIRDGVVFTDKRIITINIQGMTGKKKDLTSLSYKRIQAFSIETAGILDLDSELELWFSGLGKVKLEFSTRTNISAICKIISNLTL